MIKVKKYKPTEPLLLDYDKLFIIPTKDIEASFSLSKEDLTALIEKLKEENGRKIGKRSISRAGDK